MGKGKPKVRGKGGWQKRGEGERKGKRIEEGIRNRRKREKEASKKRKRLTHTHQIKGGMNDHIYVFGQFM